jgi:hypothetical protein
MIVAMLGIAVLCGFGFRRLTRGWSARGRTVATGVVSLALCVEFAAVPFGVEPDPVAIPAADRWLDTQPKPFVVAELPLMDPTIPMLHSMAHWQKIVHGYSGWNPPLSQEVAAHLATFPDEASLGLLQQVGVRYVVIHGGMYPPADWRDLQGRLDRSGDRLTLQFEEGDDRVYRLRRHHAAAAAYSPGSPASTRSWQPSSRVSVAPGSTSAGLKAPGD